MEVCTGQDLTPIADLLFYLSLHVSISKLEAEMNVPIRVYIVNAAPDDIYMIEIYGSYNTTENINARYGPLPNGGILEIATAQVKDGTAEFTIDIQNQLNEVSNQIDFLKLDDDTSSPSYPSPNWNVNIISQGFFKAILRQNDDDNVKVICVTENKQ